MRKTLLIILAIIATVGTAVVVAGFSIVFSSNTTSFEGERSVYVPPGSGFAQVTDSLEAAEILRSRRSFRFLGRATGWAGQMKAGHYAFEAGASNYEMLDRLRKGLQTPVRVTIPPGTRPEIMAIVAASRMAFEEEDLLAALRDSSLAAELGTDTAHLFGYMLPETYHFFWLTPAPTFVRRVKQFFDSFFDEEMRAAAQELGLSVEEAIRLASIVEWEAQVYDERPRMAGVYLNRLRIRMPLQADPTVQFAVIEREGQKRRLFFEDYRIQHPYNTYLRQGLPPGPVTNPSPGSLRATVRPEQHRFLYFVARGDGTHVFSETFQEHVNAANRFRALMRERDRERLEAQRDAR
jgi:UPF0755 protein